MSPKLVNKEEKKKAILSAARTVFAKEGFAATKIEDVAREAGIGKGTIYEYFRSKDDIFFALYEEMKIELHRRIFEFDGISSPKVQVNKMITSALLALEEWRDFGYILLDFWAMHKSGTSMKLRFDEIYDDARSSLSVLIKEGMRTGDFKKVNPSHAASALIAIIDGLMLQWIFNPKSFTLKTIAVTVSDIIAQGIENKG
ncbi:MAG TPA: TetR/AcrR family transcriptional regulator [Nitrospirota bacterium]|nr:TetR/AcrR family transcriptional regulator [Nitrospirota bacterium]